MSADERGEAPKPRWFATWWGLVLIGIGGSVAPQLCALIPNVVGSSICNTVVKAAVLSLPVASSSQKAIAAPAPAPDCPPELRLSTGACMKAPEAKAP